jgi:hypothetical protein
MIYKKNKTKTASINRSNQKYKIGYRHEWNRIFFFCQMRVEKDAKKKQRDFQWDKKTVRTIFFFFFFFFGAPTILLKI